MGGDIDCVDLFCMIAKAARISFHVLVYSSLVNIDAFHLTLVSFDFFK